MGKVLDPFPYISVTTDLLPMIHTTSYPGFSWERRSGREENPGKGCRNNPRFLDYFVTWYVWAGGRVLPHVKCCFRVFIESYCIYFCTLVGKNCLKYPTWTSEMSMAVVWTILDRVAFHIGNNAKFKLWDVAENLITMDVLADLRKVSVFFIYLYHLTFAI